MLAALAHELGLAGGAEFGEQLARVVFEQQLEHHFAYARASS